MEEYLTINSILIYDFSGNKIYSKHSSPQIEKLGENLEAHEKHVFARAFASSSYGEVSPITLSDSETALHRKYDDVFVVFAFDTQCNPLVMHQAFDALQQSLKTLYKAATVRLGDVLAKPSLLILAIDEIVFNGFLSCSLHWLRCRILGC